MIKKLPHWVITDKHPAFYDMESSTAIEQTAKLYGKMTELIDDYNAFVDEVNRITEEYITGAIEDYETFKVAVNQKILEFTTLIETHLKDQDVKINDTIIYIKNNLSTYLSDNLRDVLKEAINEGLLNDQILDATEELLSPLWTSISLNQNNIGDLTNLNTITKQNLVGSINEVNEKFNNIVFEDIRVGNLANLNTDVKTSIVDSINNEVSKRIENEKKLYDREVIILDFTQSLTYLFNYNQPITEEMKPKLIRILELYKENKQPLIIVRSSGHFFIFDNIWIKSSSSCDFSSLPLISTDKRVVTCTLSFNPGNDKAPFNPTGNFTINHVQCKYANTTEMGNLSNLNTSTKLSIVNAINEVNTKVNNINVPSESNECYVLDYTYNSNINDSSNANYNTLIDIDTKVSNGEAPLVELKYNGKKVPFVFISKTEDTSYLLRFMSPIIANSYLSQENYIYYYMEITVNTSETSKSFSINASPFSSLITTEKTLKTFVGDKQTLNTTDKENLVLAINEVKQDALDVENDLGPLADLNTLDKTSFAKAISEVNTLALNNQTNIGNTSNALYSLTSSLKVVQVINAIKNIEFYSAVDTYTTSVITSKSTLMNSDSTYVTGIMRKLNGKWTNDINNEAFKYDIKFEISEVVHDGIDSIKVDLIFTKKEGATITGAYTESVKFNVTGTDSTQQVEVTEEVVGA